MQLRIWTVTAALGAVIIGHAAVASATPVVEVSGSTVGCFDSTSNCGSSPGNFTSTANSDPLYGLTFNGASGFDVFTDGTGSASNIHLGDMTRGNVNVSDSTAPASFTLQVFFNLPTGITPGGPTDTFGALITGMNNGGGGGETIDFDNSWITVNFDNPDGSGSFQFQVTSDLDLNKNHSAPILGAIRSTPFTSNQDIPAPVPEPASMILFGTGLVGVASRFSRKRR